MELTQLFLGCSLLFSSLRFSFAHYARPIGQLKNRSTQRRRPGEFLYQFARHPCGGSPLCEGVRRERKANDGDNNNNKLNNIDCAHLCEVCQLQKEEEDVRETIGGTKVCAKVSSCP